MKRRSRVFRVLGEPSKYVALKMLNDHGDMTVTELGDKLAVLGMELGQPAMSHLTGVLENQGAITKTRAGKSVVCSLNAEFLMGLNVFGGSAIASPKKELQPA
jgi:DNA-binding transcriptional ArsR family regulator